MLSEFNLLIAVAIFLAYIVIDGLYVKYTLEVVSLNPLRSANIGVAIHLILAFGVISYTNNWFYIIPLVIGSWIGTYLVVKKEKQKKK